MSHAESIEINWEEKSCN